jgi:hypothetical protein
VRYEDLGAAPAETMRKILGHCRLSHGDLPDRAAARIRPPD